VLSASKAYPDQGRRQKNFQRRERKKTRLKNSTIQPPALSVSFWNLGGPLPMILFLLFPQLGHYSLFYEVNYRPIVIVKIFFFLGGEKKNFWGGNSPPPPPPNPPPPPPPVAGYIPEVQQCFKYEWLDKFYLGVFTLSNIALALSFKN